MIKLNVADCVGNFVGPLCFKEQDYPRYVPGFIVTVVTTFVAAVLVLVYRMVCLWDNRRRDATGVLEGFEHAYEDDLTDKTVSNPTNCRTQLIILEPSIPVYCLTMGVVRVV